LDIFASELVHPVIGRQVLNEISPKPRTLIFTRVQQIAAYISLPRYGSRIGLRIVLFEACSAFTRVTACTLALSPYFVTRLPEGFSHFVTSIAAPVASGWSNCRVGLAPTGKAPPYHGARQKRTFSKCSYGRPHGGKWDGFQLRWIEIFQKRGEYVEYQGGSLGWRRDPTGSARVGHKGQSSGIGNVSS
jgi:hypothetical protein